MGMCGGIAARADVIEWRAHHERGASAKRWTKEGDGFTSICALGPIFVTMSRSTKVKTQPSASREKMLVRVPGRAERVTAPALDRASEAPDLAQGLG